MKKQKFSGAILDKKKEEKARYREAKPLLSTRKMSQQPAIDSQVISYDPNLANESGMYEDCEDRQNLKNTILPPLNVRSMNNSYNQDIKANTTGLETKYEPLKALKDWGQRPIPAEDDPNRSAKINTNKLKLKTFSEKKELQNLYDGQGRN